MIQTTTTDVVVNIAACEFDDPAERIRDTEGDLERDLRVDAVAIDEASFDIGDGDWVGWDDHGCDVFAHRARAIVEILIEEA